MAGPSRGRAAGGEGIVRARHRGGPPFSEGWSGLALCYAVIADDSVRISFQDAFARGRQAAEQVLTLDPTMAEPYAARTTPRAGS